MIESLVYCLVQQEVIKLVTDTVCIVKKQRINKHDSDDPISVAFIALCYLQHESGVLGENHHENAVDSIQVIILLEYITNTITIPAVVMKEIQRQD